MKDWAKYFIVYNVIKHVTERDFEKWLEHLQGNSDIKSVNRIAGAMHDRYFTVEFFGHEAPTPPSEFIPYIDIFDVKISLVNRTSQYTDITGRTKFVPLSTDTSGRASYRWRNQRGY